MWGLKKNKFLMDEVKTRRLKDFGNILIPHSRITSASISIRE